MEMETENKSVFDNSLEKNLKENKELDFLFKEFNDKSENEDKIDIIKIDDEVNLIINNYKKAIKGLVEFPRLKNTIIQFIKMNNNPFNINDCYKMYLLVYKEEQFFIETKHYYKSIIKNNNYGIDDLFLNKNINIINPDIIEDPSYENFINVLSNWYSLNEMFLLSLYYLLEYFTIEFKYDINELNSLSFDLEKKINLFSSDNAYKWAGFIMKYSKKTIKSNIESLFSYFKNFFNQNLFLIGKYALDNIVGEVIDKTSSNINIQALINELEKYTNYIKILNSELEDVNNDINSLLKHEIKIYVENKLNNNSYDLQEQIQKREKLMKRVQNYFEGFVDIDKLNYEVLEDTIKEKELNDGWTEMMFNKD